jgi:hypothetical protein
VLQIRQRSWAERCGNTVVGCSNDDRELVRPLGHAANHEEGDDELVDRVLVVGVLKDVVDGDAAHEVVHEAAEQAWVLDDVIELGALGYPLVEDAPWNRLGRFDRLTVVPLLESLLVGQIAAVIAAVDARSTVALLRRERVAAYLARLGRLIHVPQVRAHGH